MEAEAIIIGDEILYGQTIDTNSAFIGKELSRIGVSLSWVTTVGDDEGKIGLAFRQALSRADVVITTGGLGPTPDDVTKKAVARTFDRELVLRDNVLRQIEDKLARWGLKIPPGIVGQALVPEGAEIIDNEVGVAPGLLLSHEGKPLFVLPGVSREMEAMLEKGVIPRLRGRGTGKVIDHRTLKVTGINESELVEKLGEMDRTLAETKITFLPGLSGIDIRLSAHGGNVEQVKEKLSTAEMKIRERLGDYVYGVDEESLERVVGRLLLSKKATLAIAESCTGGLIANRITNISGSSEYFEQGVVAYSNQAKNEVLKVPQKTIQEHGAVSPQTAKAMAEGVREISGADIGLGATGIAGPTGGTPEKPVGLVYVALAHEGGSFAKRFQFFGDRIANKERTAQAGLNELRLFLIKN